jgi:glycerol-3-phosphate cytidylyltransferase
MNGKVKKFKIGYTTGVFDMFHIGHLNLLKRAKELCSFLIVGVSTDELVLQYKYRKPIIKYSERFEIVSSITYVDKVVPQKNRDKIKAYRKYNFDVMFVGDDWKGDPLFTKVEKELNKFGSYIVYLPYTKKVSSTKLMNVLNKLYS